MALRAIGLALGFIAHVLLSRSLGLQGYGHYVIALGWAMVLVLPARVGFDNSAVRYVTIYLESNDPAALRGFIRTATVTVTAASLAIGAIMVLVGSIAADLPYDAMVTWAAVSIAPVALLGLHSVILRSAGRISASQFYDQILRPALLILLVVMLPFVGGRLDPAKALMLTAFAALAALAFLLLHCRAVLRSSRSTGPDYSAWRDWFAVSLPLLFIGVSQELLNQLEIILLGALADARSAGLFSGAWRLASLMPFALASIGVVSGPMVASAYHRRDLAELNRITGLAARLALGFAVCIGLVLVAAGRPLLELFGADFVQAYPALLILLIGGVVNAFTGVVAYLLTLTGRQMHGLAIFAGALGVSLALNLLLIPRFGMVGAAIASTAALISWNLAMAIFVRRTMGVDATALALPPHGSQG